MAASDYSAKTVLIIDNIFLKTYRAVDADYKQFINDINEQLRLGLLFDNASSLNSLNTLIQTYQLIRNGLYLNKAQQVSLDYKTDEGQIETKAIYLTKEDYLKLKTLSAVETQDKTIKSYKRLQDLILGNENLLKTEGTNKRLNEEFFTFELYRDRVLGLFDTFEGDFPDKADKLLKGYQKSYEEALETLEDLVTSNNPLRSGYYRMYNESPEVRQTVDAFKRALLEKAAIDANDRSEFKTMELGLMKLLQYGSLDDRLRKQILALIQQNAEGRAKVVGGARDENYAILISKLLNDTIKIKAEQIQKPPIAVIGAPIKAAWKEFSGNLSSFFKKSETGTSTLVEPNYLNQLEKDLTSLTEAVNQILPTLNASIPEDQLKLKMYEELLANLELLLGLIMDIKQTSLADSSSLKVLYKNLKEALQKVIQETKELNDSSHEIVELMGSIANSVGALTDLPSEQVAAPPTQPQPISSSLGAPEPEPEMMTFEQQQKYLEAEQKLEDAEQLYNRIADYYTNMGENPDTIKPIRDIQENIKKANEFKTNPIEFIKSVIYQDPRSSSVEGSIRILYAAANIRNTREPGSFETLVEIIKDNVGTLSLPESVSQTSMPNIQEAVSEMEPISEEPEIVPETPSLPASPEIVPETPSLSASPEIVPETPSLPAQPLLPPLARQSIINPVYEETKSDKQQLQAKIKNMLETVLPKYRTYSDPKFTVKELNEMIGGLSEEDQSIANLLRIAFFVSNIQENAESNDRDMDGLTESFFSKMMEYFDKSRLPTAYTNIAQSLPATYPIDITNPTKQIQIDLYCMLVDQLYALHNKQSYIATYAANTEGRNFKSIDSRGIDQILLDTILPKFRNDSEPPIYEPSYVKAVKTYGTFETYLQDLGDTRPTIDQLLQNHFIVLKKMDNNTNRRNFLTGCIDYLVKKYKSDATGKQILYKLLVGKDNYGTYAQLSTMGGDINLSEENKDMDGGAGKEEPVDANNLLENIKKASEKLDEYRKALRGTQEELNSWKEKFINYDKSVDITKDFKPVEEPDRETIQFIKVFYDYLSEAYNNVINARKEEERVKIEGEQSIKEAADKVNLLTEERSKAATTEQSNYDDRIEAARKEITPIKLEVDRKNDEAKQATKAAEDNFTQQFKAFLEDKLAKGTNKLNEFVNKLKKVLPGEISAASSETDLAEKLLNIKDLMAKIDKNTQGGNYYTATEIVSIYEFLKGKAADLKKFNTERFNAMDKKIREIYQFILTTNKPLEKKEKFKLKRIELESILDGSDNTGIQQTLNIFDDQRFKDLIVVDKTKKSIKGLLPTIKDIKRLMETDIDYFTSLFQQKTTSILKQQEIERQKGELAIRQAQPQAGPIAFFNPQGYRQAGGAEIDTDTRKKLKSYFGINLGDETLPEEEGEKYKDVQLYLDVFNKLIDSYKFSLMTVTDPAAALALSGDKSLFNMIYEKYLKSAEDETKGSFIASQELSTALETNNLVPRNVLRVSLRDKIVILFTTLFMRLITLSTVEFMIEKGVLKNLKYTLLAYLGFFSILFIAFTALINLDLYRLRIVFNYLNFHANSDKVYSYILLLWAFGGIIYYIITNVNPDITITNTSEDVKARLIYRIQVISLIIWLFLMIMIFIF